MKKHNLIALLIIFFSSANFIATAQTKIWSLQECVNYAIENNITIQKGTNSLLTGEQDIKSAKGNFLPLVSATINQGLGLGNQELFQGQFVNRTSHTTSVGISVSQTIFNGFQNTNLYKQAQLNLERNQMELNRIKDDVSLNVVNFYLNVLFNKENLEVAKLQVEFSKKQLEQVQALVDAGSQPQANLFDAQATLSSDIQSLTVSENNYTLAKLSLTQLLQLPYEDFQIEPMTVDSPTASMLYASIDPILDYAYENRFEIKVAEKNIENAQLNTELAKGGYLPNLTFGYGFGSNVFYSNLIEGEQGFFTQLDDQKSHNFNLRLGIPIFSRFDNKTSVAKSRIQEENSKLDLEQTKIDLEANIQRAFTDAQAAYRTFESSQASVKAQELALQNAQQRFEIGALNSFDFEQIRIRYLNAESQLINAKFDFVFKIKILDFYLGKPVY